MAGRSSIQCSLKRSLNSEHLAPQIFGLLEVHHREALLLERSHLALGDAVALGRADVPDAMKVSQVDAQLVADRPALVPTPRLEVVK